MKLMVVDDNKQVREGISLGIDWKCCGISEVKMCEDGLEAKEALEDFWPDVIIADICMPNLDGIELLKEVRGYGKSCRYIILSAYSEFSYAQKALKLGANDYILKPVKPKELVALVMRNIEELSKMQMENETYYQIYEKGFLHALLNGEAITETEKLKEMLAHRYQMELEENFIFLAVLTLERLDAHARKTAVPERIRGRIREELLRSGYAAWLGGGEELLVMRKGSRSELKSQEFRIAFKREMAVLNEKYAEEKTMITSGVSRAESLQNLPKAYQQGMEALCLSYYQSAGSCILYGEESGKKQKEFTEDRQKAYMKELASAVKSRQMQDAEQILGTIQSEAAQEGYSPSVMHAFFKKLYFYLLHYGGVKENVEFEQILMDRIMRLNVVTDEFKAFLRQSMAGDTSAETEKCSVVIRNICAYTEEHFKEPLTVELLGEKFNRTPNYISAKFKREVGKSFTDYLIELRIRKALNMLMYTDIPISEIAFETGFGSYAYFSRIFRKYTGKTAGSVRGASRE